MGFDSGSCEGIAGFAWGTEKAAVTADGRFTLNTAGDPVLENAEFGGVSGTLKLHFSKADETLIGATFTPAGENAVEDYISLFTALTSAYGTNDGPSSMVSSDGTVTAPPTPEELRENGNTGSAAQWIDIPAGENGSASVMLTLFPDGQISLQFILTD